MTHDHEEAFAVADRMALMRDGGLVQAGTPAEVWAAPADADAAGFLGYAAVLDGERAGVVLAAAGVDRRGQVALRRSALRVTPDGALSGRVVSARATPEATRLVVDVTGVGQIGAVAGGTGPAPGPGEEVRLSVDASRVAVIPLD